MRTYFVNLTSRRAAHLFIVFLAVGIVCTIADFGLPWTPAVAVAAYGSLLLYTEVKYVVSHSEMTVNSPYFLAFLFFLTSLLRTFTSLSLKNADVALDTMLHELGGALLATIVGLPFRQLLSAYHPTQADQDFFFRTLEEEIRRSATEFKRAQAELVQLVQEFTETRKTLFADEEHSSRRYVESLDKASGLFDTSFDTYPIIISSALSHCAESLEVLKGKAGELSSAAQLVDPLKISSLVDQFSTLKEHSATLASGLSSLNTAVNGLEKMSGALPGQVKAHLLTAQSDFDEVRRQLRGKIDVIDADIRAIDKLLTDFVDVTQERIGVTR